MSSSSSIQGPGGTTPPIDQSKISWHRGKTSSGKPVSSLTGETVLEKFKKPLEKIKTLCAPLLNQSETATEIPHKDIYATAVALKDLCTKENLSKMDPSQKIQ